MATFLERVTALTEAPDSNTELGVWLSDGVVDVIRRFKLIDPGLLHRFAQEKNIGSSGLDLGTPDKILEVLPDVRRGSYECREIPPQARHRATRSTSLYYATAQHPKYYRLNNILTVLPQPSTAQAYASVVIPSSSVAYGDSNISNFPAEFYYLIVLYASLRNLESKISGVTSDSTPEIDTIPVPVPPIDPSFTTPSITLGAAPAYTGPTKALNITTAMTTITTQIETDEDVELALSKIQQAGEAVRDYVSEVQNAMNEFTESNVVYQAALQKEIEEARLGLDEESKEYAARMEQYLGEVRGYEAEIVAKAQAVATDHTKVGWYLSIYRELVLRYEESFIPFKEETRQRGR